MDYSDGIAIATGDGENINTIDKLIKQCLNLDEKLSSLENAMSGIGGARDISEYVGQLQASMKFAIALKEFTENGGTYIGNSLKVASLGLDKLLEHAGLLERGFNDLGDANDCHFRTFCNALNIIKLKRQYCQEVKRFRYSEGKARELAKKHIARDPALELLSADLDRFSKVIVTVVDKDLPILQALQEKFPKYYSDMTAIAAFFSAITATVLSMSIPKTDSFIENAVNTAWLISLVFSIVSVLVSLVGMLWNQSDIPMRSRDSQLKKDVITLLHKGPALSMTAASVAFMIGFALFVNASNQARATSLVVTIVILLVSITVIVALIVYFAMRYEVAYTLSWTKLVDWISSFLQREREIILFALRRYMDNKTDSPPPDNQKPWVLLSWGALGSAIQCFLLRGREIYCFLPSHTSGIDNNVEQGTALAPSIQPTFSPDAPPDCPSSSSAGIYVSLGTFDGPLAVVKRTSAENYVLNVYMKNEGSILTAPSPISWSFSTHEGDDIKRLLWSPDNEKLLILTSRSLKIWSEKKEYANFNRLGEMTSIHNAIWSNDSQKICVARSESISSIECNNGVLRNLQPEDDLLLSWKKNKVVAALVLSMDKEYLVCAVIDNDNDNSTLRAIPMVNAPSGEGKITQSFYMKGNISSIHLATTGASNSNSTQFKILVSFAEHTPPQLCQLETANGSFKWELPLVYQIEGDRFEPQPEAPMSLKYLSPVSFAGSEDELVMCAASSEGSLPDRILAWSTKEAVLIRNIDISGLYTKQHPVSGLPYNELPVSVTWKIDESYALSLVAAYADENVVRAENINFFSTYSLDLVCQPRAHKGLSNVA